MISYLLYSAVTLNHITFDQDELKDPGIVNVTLSAEVDAERSLFWYQDMPIYAEDGKLYFHVYEEDETIFKYVLKDQAGNILEESEKSIVLDSLAPVINVYKDEYLIEDVFYLIDEDGLKIDVTDAHLKDVKVYLDNELVSEQQQATIDITRNSKELRIIANDLYGHEIQKTIEIKSIKAPESTINIENEGYILDPLVTLKFDQQVLEPLSLVVLTDGIETHRISCKDKEQIDVTLEHTGDTLLKLEHENAPYLQMNIQGQKELLTHFSNEELVLNMRPDAFVSNQNVFVSMDWSTRYLKNTYLEIWNGEFWIQRDLIDQIVFAAVPDQEIHYYAKASIEDEFSRRVEKEVSVVVDCKAPNISLVSDSKIMQANEINILPKTSVIEYQSDETSTVDVKLYKNDTLIENVSLNQAFQQLSFKDVLRADITSYDRFNNTAFKSFYFQIEPVKLNDPVIKTSYELNLFEDKQVVDRIFEINENNEVTHSKVVKKVVDKTKPKVQFIQKDHKTLKILLLKNGKYSNDYFEMISVNGKKVDLNKLKKDQLGNLYYEFNPNESNCIVKVVARDAQGNETRVEQEFTFSSFDWAPIGIASLFSIALLIGLGYIIKIKNG